MSMFDYVICHHPLPNKQAWAGERGYQTKSMDCLMATYTITEDGRLLHDITHTELVPPEERPEGGGKLGFMGMLREVVDEENVLCPYTGVLYFYDYDPPSDKNGQRAQAVDYYAYFEQGQLQALIEVNPATDEVEGERLVMEEVERLAREKLRNTIASEVSGSGHIPGLRKM